MAVVPLSDPATAGRRSSISILNNKCCISNPLHVSQPGDAQVRGAPDQPRLDWTPATTAIRHQSLDEREGIETQKLEGGGWSGEGPLGDPTAVQPLRGSVLDLQSSEVPFALGLQPDSAITYISFVSFALIYIHPIVSTVCFRALYCDAIHLDTAEVQYWLNADRGVQCFTPWWYTFVSVAVFVIITFVLGMPLGLIALTRCLHHRKLVRTDSQEWYTQAAEIRMEERVVAAASQCTASEEAEQAEEGALELQWRTDSIGRGYSTTIYSAPDLVSGKVIEVQPVFLAGAQPGSGVDAIRSQLLDPMLMKYFGGYTTSFQPKFYYWMGYDMLVRLFQTSMVVLVRMANERYDLVYMLLVTMCALAVHAHVHPYVSANINLLQTITFLSQGITCLGYITMRDVIVEDTGGLGIGSGMLFLQGLILLMASKYVMSELLDHMKDEDSVLFEVHLKAKVKISSAAASMKRSFRRRFISLNSGDFTIPSIFSEGRKSDAQ
ncbi:hypothetical protein CYMTET_14540 [Cymbomonas tetramitiformis]|uniref:Uncharacterized protein n=1 Tax=Cymbomonas tetramitiformis TaxID=36881 RepID=A0AAE0LA27_9CHLO|nr:hypothetical protein CYMTET_14540 [Cymbomonas tetramitiformis]